NESQAALSKGRSGTRPSLRLARNRLDSRIASTMSAKRALAPAARVADPAGHGPSSRTQALTFHDVDERGGSSNAWWAFETSWYPRAAGVSRRGLPRAVRSGFRP